MTVGGSAPSSAVPVSADEFAAAMATLGPLPANRRIAVAVSGGADSLALALLVTRWVASSSSSSRPPCVALVVDHALRPDSRADAEAAATACARLGLAPTILTLAGLAPGPALQARARTARHLALTEACRQVGLTDLALGHHRDDQAETIAMRCAKRTGPIGAAGMAALSERHGLRVLRPLLATDPARLRATLVEAGIPWSEDPSNRDPRFLRTRLRAAGQGTTPDFLATSRRRRIHEAEALDWLARHVTLHEAGYALLPDAPLPEAALSVLLRTLAGAEHPPPRAAVARLARAPAAATLHGVRLARAPRGVGQGWIAFREASAMRPPIPLATGAVWDRRFRLVSEVPRWLIGGTLGPLGSDAAAADPELPAALRRTLPAIRDPNGRLQAFAPLDLTVAQGELRVIFAPPNPLSTDFFTIPVQPAP